MNRRSLAFLVSSAPWVLLVACAQSPTISRPSDEARPDSSGPDGPGTDEMLAPDSPAWAKVDVFPMKRAPSDCEARRRGDQIRIACKSGFANAAEQLAGAPEGVRFKKTKDGELPAIAFPLRRGERRVFQYASYEASRWSWGAFAGRTISAYWLEAEPTPTIVIH